MDTDISFGEGVSCEDCTWDAKAEGCKGTASEAGAPLDAEFPSDDGDLFEDGVLFEEFSLEEWISFEDCTWDAKAVAFKEPVLEVSAPLDIEVPSDAG